LEQLDSEVIEKVIVEDEEPSEDSRIVKITNGKTTPWVADAFVPSKPNKFRPVYISLMLRMSDALTDGLTFDELVSERHFSTYFITPIFTEPEDHKYVSEILVPYLRAVAESKHINWNVVPTTKKGQPGVVVPGRLAASLMQGMNTVKPCVPHLFNFLFLEET